MRYGQATFRVLLVPPTSQQHRLSLLQQQQPPPAPHDHPVHILQEFSDQEEQPHAGPGPGSAPKQHIYHADAIHEKLEDIAWAEEAPWEESLVVTNAEPTVVTNCDDDLERELAFYNQVGQPLFGSWEKGRTAAGCG